MISLSGSHTAGLYEQQKESIAPHKTIEYKGYIKVLDSRCINTQEQIVVVIKCAHPSTSSRTESKSRQH
jgi:hypothetical protein